MKFLVSNIIIFNKISYKALNLLQLKNKIGKVTNSNSNTNNNNKAQSIFQVHFLDNISFKLEEAI